MLGKSQRFLTSLHHSLRHADVTIMLPKLFTWFEVVPQ
jgi:hypothetical protein